MHALKPALTRRAFLFISGCSVSGLRRTAPSPRTHMQRGWTATMTHVNARTAARLTAKDRSTILRALESGRLSATKDERGQWLIDPAELERVYGQLHLPDEPEVASDHDTYAMQVAALTKEVELL